MDNVKMLKSELQEHMKEYKADQELKRQSMHKQIQEQKKQISEKEALIREKHAELKKTEEEYEVKLKGLNLVYESEQKKKNDLEMNLKAVKQDLEDIKT